MGILEVSYYNLSGQETGLSITWVILLEFSTIFTRPIGKRGVIYTKKFERGWERLSNLQPLCFLQVKIPHFCKVFSPGIK